MQWLLRKALGVTRPVRNWESTSVTLFSHAAGAECALTQGLQGRCVPSLWLQGWCVRSLTQLCKLHAASTLQPL